MTNLLTIPTVFSSSNKALKDEANNPKDTLRKLLDEGYKITHVSSAALDNVLYVTYVLEK